MQAYHFKTILLLLLLPFVMGAQEKGTPITLTGILTDSETGLPLPYASVYDEKGGFGSSHTDENGRYSVQIIKGNNITFARQFYYGRRYIVNFDTFNIALKPIPKEVIEKMEQEALEKMKNNKNKEHEK